MPVSGSVISPASARAAGSLYPPGVSGGWIAAAQPSQVAAALDALAARTRWSEIPVVGLGFTTTSTYDTTCVTAQFADGADRFVTFGGRVPADYDSTSNPQLLVPTIITAAAVQGTADWRLDVRSMAVGESANQAVVETLTQSIIYPNTVNLLGLQTWTLNGSLLAPGDILRFVLNRLGLSGGTDDYAGTVNVPRENAFFRYAR